MQVTGYTHGTGWGQPLGRGRTTVQSGQTCPTEKAEGHGSSPLPGLEEGTGAGWSASPHQFAPGPLPM